MKRYATVLFCIAMLVVLSTAGVLAAPLATVQTASGASLRRHSVLSFSALSSRTPLNAGDVVRTGARGKASLLFFDGSQVRLNFNTTVEITASTDAGNGRQSFFRALAGEVWARMRPGSAARSRTAVAGVRGTEILMQVAEDSTTTLTTLEGVVDFYNDFGAVVVNAGQQSTAAPGRAPSTPITILNPGPLAQWAFGPDEKWNPATKTWMKYSLLTVDLASRGETFTGMVITETADGQRDLAGEGDEVVFAPTTPNADGSFEGQVTTVRGGQIKIPPFVKENGNVYLVGTLIRAIDRVGGKTPDLKTCPQFKHHVEVLLVPQNAPTKIARASQVINAGAPLWVEGQNLELKNAALESASGERIRLGPPVASSSLQQVYLAPTMPLGKYRFVAEDKNGKALRALNESSNDSEVKIKGSGIKQVGERGMVTVTSNIDGFVVLVGGEPQITLEQYSVTTRAGVPVKIPFRANVVGDYHVRAILRNPEDAPVESDAPRVDAKAEPVETRYDAAKNQTQVKCPLSVQDETGKPVKNTSTRVAVTTPNGVEYGECSTDDKGRASFSCTLPGKIRSDSIKTHIYKVTGREWNK